MKRFFFRIPVAETSAFEACLEAWRAADPKAGPRAQLEARPFGLLLRLPAADVVPFCEAATAPLSAFSRARLLAAARDFAARAAAELAERAARQSSSLHDYD